jgi:archaeosine synthase beta-subunit
MNFSFIDTIYDPLKKRQVTRWVLELPGAGCEWYKQTGGCTMCAFSQSTQKYTFGGRLFPHFVFMILFYYAYWLVRKQRPELLVIYNGGSFLSDKEIPRKTQLALMRFVAKHPTINKVLVESRANLVTAEKLRLYAEALEGKKLEIALGLESSDDQIRNQCLHKGLTKEIFERAVNLCHQYKVDVFAYAYLKPHCLDEETAVTDAINTINYCFGVGVDEISLSCAFVQADTLLEKLYNEGEFVPPKLWSIIKVIQATANRGHVRIGHFNDEPPPIAIPKNCPQCNQRIMAAIEKYRQTHDVSIFDQLDCGCKNS